MEGQELFFVLFTTPPLCPQERICWMDEWLGGWMMMVDDSGCLVDRWVVDAYVRDAYMEGRKDDLGSTVRPEFSTMQSRGRREVCRLPAPQQCWVPVGGGGTSSPDSLLCSGDGVRMGVGRGRESFFPPGPTLSSYSPTQIRFSRMSPGSGGKAHYL